MTRLAFFVNLNGETCFFWRYLHPDICTMIIWYLIIIYEVECKTNLAHVKCWKIVVKYLLLGRLLFLLVPRWHIHIMKLPLMQFRNPDFIKGVSIFKLFHYVLCSLYMHIVKMKEEKCSISLGPSRINLELEGTESVFFVRDQLVQVLHVFYPKGHLKFKHPHFSGVENYIVSYQAVV